jgi:glutathione S-transferase
VRTWEALADGLIDAAILARLEANWPGRTAEQRSQAWIDRQMKKIDAALEAMSTGLAEKPWCTGIHMTLADIAVGCALGYLASASRRSPGASGEPGAARRQDERSPELHRHGAAA